MTVHGLIQSPNIPGTRHGLLGTGNSTNLPRQSLQRRSYRCSREIPFPSPAMRRDPANGIVTDRFCGFVMDDDGRIDRRRWSFPRWRHSRPLSAEVLRAARVVQRFKR